MRACRHCGLSIGARATYCPVCGTLVEPDDPTPTMQSEPPSSVPSRQEEAADRESVAALLVQEAQRCEKMDVTRAAALYRLAIGEFLELGEDPLDKPQVRRPVLLAFDRLSLVLMRSGLQSEALEEIDSAASLGLLDRQDAGSKGHRETLNKRRIRLRRAVAQDRA